MRSSAEPGSADLASSSLSRGGGLDADPPICTGVAAPRFVAGAIAATWLAYTRNVPALAARAPLGDTYVTTGTSEASIACTMSRIDVSSPPGVSIVTTTTEARCSFASLRALTKKSLVAGPMGPEIGSRMPPSP